MSEIENTVKEVIEHSENGGDTTDGLPDKLALLKQYKETIVHLCNYQNEYTTRIESLLESWNYIALIMQQSTQEASENLLHWVLKYTVRLILVGDWVKIPQEKRDTIKRKIEEIVPKLQFGSMSLYRCEYILKNIENPWGDEELLNVLRGDPWIVTESDLTYLTAERGCMILLRLQKLCETKCDDMAFAWSSKALKAYRTVGTEHALMKSTSQRQYVFIFDVYLCYLHKYGHVSKIIDEVKSLDLESAQQLIARNVSPNAEISRLTKYRQRVARLVADIMIAKLMVEELSEQNEKYYCDILKEWLCFHKTVPVAEFRKIARKLYMTAISRKHLYLACDIIKKMEVNEWRDLVLELCVRGITGDLNELELLKSEKSCDEYIVIQHEIDLSYRYNYLADLLRNHSHLAQECILTAFSLNPTKENYQLVKDIAVKHQKNEHSTTPISVTRSGSVPPAPSATVTLSTLPTPAGRLNQTLHTPTFVAFNERVADEVGDSSTQVACTQSESLKTSKTSLKFPQVVSPILLESLQTKQLSKTPETQASVAIPAKIFQRKDLGCPETKHKPSPAEIRAHRSSIDVLHSITGSSKILESPSYDALAAPSLILDSIETMDLPDHIRMDLSVLLSSPRLKILSWMLPWHELDAHCQKLLKEDCKLSIVRQSLAVANDRLQYLNLDYNQFKHLPESECPGIEKGYEMYSMDSDDDLDNLSDVNLSVDDLKRRRRKKYKRTKESKGKSDRLAKQSKRPREKVPKQPKKATTKQSRKTVKDRGTLNSLGQQPNTSSTTQKAREYEALIRALYYQQLQHQLQLSQSLAMLNQNTPINRNFFLPYLAAQLQERARLDRQVMPPPPTIPLQKIARKSEPVKKQPKKESTTVKPQPPQRLQLSKLRTHVQSLPTASQLHQQLQIPIKSQPQPQSQPPPLQLQSQVQQQLQSQSHLQPQATTQQPQSQLHTQLSNLLTGGIIRDNTLVKLAILQNLTQKMLLQQQQQQMQLQQQPSTSKVVNSSASPPGLVLNPYAFLPNNSVSNTKRTTLPPAATAVSAQKTPPVNVPLNPPVLVAAAASSTATSAPKMNFLSPGAAALAASLLSKAQVVPGEGALATSFSKKLPACKPPKVPSAKVLVAKGATTKTSITKTTVTKASTSMAATGRHITTKVATMKPVTSKTPNLKPLRKVIPVKAAVAKAPLRATSSKVSTPVTHSSQNTFCGIFSKENPSSTVQLQPIQLATQKTPPDDDSSTESAPESLNLTRPPQQCYEEEAISVDLTCEEVTRSHVITSDFAALNSNVQQEVEVQTTENINSQDVDVSKKSKDSKLLHEKRTQSRTRVSATSKGRDGYEKCSSATENTEEHPISASREIEQYIIKIREGLVDDPVKDVSISASQEQESNEIIDMLLDMEENNELGEDKVTSSQSVSIAMLASTPAPVSVPTLRTPVRSAPRATLNQTPQVSLTPAMPLRSIRTSPRVQAATSTNFAKPTSRQVAVPMLSQSPFLTSPQDLTQMLAPARTSAALPPPLPRASLFPTPVPIRTVSTPITTVSAPAANIRLVQTSAESLTATSASDATHTVPATPPSFEEITIGSQPKSGTKTRNTTENGAMSKSENVAESESMYVMTSKHKGNNRLVEKESDPGGGVLPHQTNNKSLEIPEKNHSSPRRMQGPDGDITKHVYPGTSFPILPALRDNYASNSEPSEDPLQIKPEDSLKTLSEDLGRCIHLSECAAPIQAVVDTIWKPPDLVAPINAVCITEKQNDQRKILSSARRDPRIYRRKAPEPVTLVPEEIPRPQSTIPRVVRREPPSKCDSIATRRQRRKTVDSYEAFKQLQMEEENSVIGVENFEGTATKPRRSRRSVVARRSNSKELEVLVGDLKQVGAPKVPNTNKPLQEKNKPKQPAQQKRSTKDRAAAKVNKKLSTNQASLNGVDGTCETAPDLKKSLEVQAVKERVENPFDKLPVLQTKRVSKVNMRYIEDNAESENHSKRSVPRISRAPSRFGHDDDGSDLEIKAIFSRPKSSLALRRVDTPRPRARGLSTKAKIPDSEQEIKRVTSRANSSIKKIQNQVSTVTARRTSARLRFRPSSVVPTRNGFGCIQSDPKPYLQVKTPQPYVSNQSLFKRKSLLNVPGLLNHLPQYPLPNTQLKSVRHSQHQQEDVSDFEIFHPTRRSRRNSRSIHRSLNESDLEMASGDELSATPGRRLRRGSTYRGWDGSDSSYRPSPVQSKRKSRRDTLRTKKNSDIIEASSASTSKSKPRSTQPEGCDSPRQNPKLRSSTPEESDDEVKSWLHNFLPNIQARRRSRRRSCVKTSMAEYSDSLDEFGSSSSEMQGAPRFPKKSMRLRRTSTVNVTYCEQDSDSESGWSDRVKPKKRSKSVELANAEYRVNNRGYKKKTAKQRPRMKRRHSVEKKSRHLQGKGDSLWYLSDLAREYENDPKLFTQQPIVELVRCSEKVSVENVIVLTSSSSDSDVELVLQDYVVRSRRKTQIIRADRDTPPPKRVKKIYLKNIRSSKIAIVNESSCSSPRTDPEHNELTDQMSKAPESVVADMAPQPPAKPQILRRSKPSVTSGISNKRQSTFPEKPVDTVEAQTEDDFIPILESQEPSLATQCPEITSRSPEPPVLELPDLYLRRRLISSQRRRLTARQLSILEQKREESQPPPLKRAVSQPPPEFVRSIPPELPSPTIRLPELCLNRLDNLTMLRYKQSILINGVLVASPSVFLKRLKVEKTPVIVHEKENMAYRKKKRWQRQPKRKVFPDSLHPALRKELNGWSNFQTKFNQRPFQIDLHSEAAVPTEQWNNLDMFQVSSDDESLSDVTVEPRKPTKIPRIDNKLSKNCNVTNGGLSKNDQPPRPATRLGGKKNFMFDIYSVVVKPDFRETPNAALFGYKKNGSSSCKRPSEASDIFLAIAAKLIAKSLAISEEKQKCLDDMTDDQTNNWIPQVLTRRYLEQATTRILLGIRNALQKTTSTIGLSKGARNLVNETIDERKNQFYHCKKLFNALSTRLDDDKPSKDVKLPAYQELRKMIYRRTLGEKFNNKITPVEKGSQKMDNRKDPLSDRLLGNVPGFRTLEYFTAPSFHCLPVVRIVHSTFPLDEKSDATASSSEASRDTFKSPAMSQAPANGQRTTIIPVFHKPLCIPPSYPGEVPTSNVRVIIPQAVTAQTKKGLKPVATATGGVAMSSALIKVDKKDLRIEPNIVLLGCGGSNKFVPIKKDERIVFASTLNPAEQKATAQTLTPIKKDERILFATMSNSAMQDTVQGSAPQYTRQGESTGTLKNASTVAVDNEKFIVSPTSSATFLPVQFIYKSDGGMVHLAPVSRATPFSNDVKAISVLKTANTTSPPSSSTDRVTALNSSLSIISTRSVYEENYAKFIHQTSSTVTPATHARQQYSASTVVRNIAQEDTQTTDSSVSASLPRFTQAFGKSIYVEAEGSEQRSVKVETVIPDVGSVPPHKKDPDKSIVPSIPGSFLLSRQNLTIARPAVLGCVSETLNKSKDSAPRIATDIKQQFEIIQDEANSGTLPQRTAHLSPTPVSVPILPHTAVSSLIQTRYVRPVLHISPCTTGASPVQTQQRQFLITATHPPSGTTAGNTVNGGFSVDKLIVTTNKGNTGILATTAARIKGLPTLTLTKCEKVQQGSPPTKEEERVDTSTLEQLREFDLVLEQVKERSTTFTAVSAERKLTKDLPGGGTAAATIEDTLQKHVATSSAAKVDGAVKFDQGRTQPPMNQGNKLNFTLLQSSPVVVVANNLTPAKILASASKNVLTFQKEDGVVDVEKNRNEVKTTQATQTAQTASAVQQPDFVLSKTKTTQKMASTLPAASSIVPAYHPQKVSKPQEDEQTVQRIYDILAEYAEQLRNSPDLNNKPAPRRRSNPLNSCSSGGKKRKTFLPKSSDGLLVVGEVDQIAADSEDSSCGTSSLYNRSPMYDSSTSVDNSSHFVRRQQLVKTEAEEVFTIVEAPPPINTSSSSPRSHQQQKQSPPALSVINLEVGSDTQASQSTTAVLVPSKYFFPLNTVKSETADEKELLVSAEQIFYKTKTLQQKTSFKPVMIHGVRQSIDIAQSNVTSPNKVVDGVQKTARVFQPTTLPGVQSGKSSVKIIEMAAIKTNPLTLVSQPHPHPPTEIDLDVRQQSPPCKVQETSVITRMMPSGKELPSQLEKKQSPFNSKKAHNTLLVSVSPPATPLSKLDGDGAKGSITEKVKNNLQLDSCRTTSSRILTQLNEGRRLAMERELKFHKSLSDECEDLGVDEPSTSDLFPEADLLFDSTSPAFENSSQDGMCTVVEDNRLPSSVKTPSKTGTLMAVLNGTSGTSVSFPVRNNLSGDNLRSACLRKVIGWETTDSPLSGKAANLVIQHTSSQTLFSRDSTSPSPVPTNLRMVEERSIVSSSLGSKNDLEEEENKNVVVQNEIQNGRKRRISTRAIARKVTSCPCCTSAPSSAVVVLSSSTQTSNFSSGGKCDLIASSQLLAHQEVQQQTYPDVKRMRSFSACALTAAHKTSIAVESPPPPCESTTVASNCIVPTAVTPANITTTAGSTTVKSLPSRRMVITNRYLKTVRR